MKCKLEMNKDRLNLDFEGSISEYEKFISTVNWKIPNQSKP